MIAKPKRSFFAFCCCCCCHATLLSVVVLLGFVLAISWTESTRPGMEVALPTGMVLASDSPLHYNLSGLCDLLDREADASSAAEVLRFYRESGGQVCATTIRNLFGNCLHVNSSEWLVLNHFLGSWAALRWEKEKKGSLIDFVHDSFPPGEKSFAASVIHGAVWQTMITADVPNEELWSFGLKLCKETRSLIGLALYHCVHGLGHGFIMKVMMQMGVATPYVGQRCMPWRAGAQQGFARRREILNGSLAILLAGPRVAYQAAAAMGMYESYFTLVEAELGIPPGMNPHQDLHACATAPVGAGGCFLQHRKWVLNEFEASLTSPDYDYKRRLVGCSQPMASELHRDACMAAGNLMAVSSSNFRGCMEGTAHATEERRAARFKACHAWFGWFHLASDLNVVTNAVDAVILPQIFRSREVEFNVSGFVSSYINHTHLCTGCIEWDSWDSFWDPSKNPEIAWLSPHFM